MSKTRHRPDRTTVSREEFDEQLDQLLDGDRWIIDGNYIRTLPLRLFHCDTVFLFDIPLEICLAGAEERLGKERVDMPWTDTVLDEEFRQWILDFPKMQLPLINLFLESYKGTVIRFNSRHEADEYIAALKSGINV